MSIKKNKTYNLTDQFIAGIYELSQREFTNSEVNLAKRCLLDYLGVTIAGSKVLENSINKMKELFDSKNEECSIVGTKLRTSVDKAAFLNGMSSHVLELDDGVRYGGIHPGGPIISALLAFSEKYRLNGNDVLKGIIVGYEAAIRLAEAMQPSHSDKGFHSTATCGIIGAAIGISVALKFSEDKMKRAMTIAALSANGTLKVIEDDSEIKPYNIGKAAMDGILAIYMCEADFLIPKDVLSGRSGFMTMMSREYDESLLKCFQSKSLKIEKNYFKVYSSCRHCHAAIEATIKIRNCYDITLDSIEKINVLTYDYVIGRHDHKNVDSISSSKMSIPYSVAVALMYGKATNDVYSEKNIYNPEIVDLIKKIFVKEKYEFSNLVPKMRPALVEVITKDAKVHSSMVNYPKGEPENPLTDQELIDKFRSLATFAGKNQSEIDLMVEYVMDIENNLDKLFKLL